MNPPAQWEIDGRNLLQWEAGEEEERDGGSTGDAGGLVRCLGCVTPGPVWLSPMSQSKHDFLHKRSPTPTHSALWPLEFLLQSSEQVCSWDFFHTACECRQG